MVTKVQINLMGIIGKLKWLLVVALLFGGTAQAHVYWDYSQPQGTTGDGTEAHPVRDWSEAKALLANQGADQWIILKTTADLAFNWTMDGSMSGGRVAQVKRNAGFTGYMFNVKSLYVRCTYSSPLRSSISSMIS